MGDITGDPELSRFDAGWRGPVPTTGMSDTIDDFLYELCQTGYTYPDINQLQQLREEGRELSLHSLCRRCK